MAEVTTGSTVPRRQLGRALRDLRGQARLTVRAAAQTLEWSEAKIWRIESGQSSMRALDVEQVCRVYGAPTDLTESLMALARETKAKGWWLDYADAINDGFDVYLGLEEAAERLRWYQAELVPGLLQTEDYARTLIRSGIPEADDAEIERRVRLRIARQTLVTRVTSPPELQVVINESILHRPVGGPTIMRAQLARLLEVGELAHVALKVIPFGIGTHAGMLSGPFLVLTFPLNGTGIPTEPPTVYIDGFTGALFLDQPHESQRYEAAFTSIWDAALGEAASRDLIHHQIKEFTP